MIDSPHPDLPELVELVDGLSAEEISELVAGLPLSVADSLLSILPAPEEELPASPVAQAQEIEPGYRTRSHLTYLSDRLTQAVRDVEAGQNRILTVSMPPRAGKSTLTSLYFPVWLLRRHPGWPVGMISNEGNFATSWGRQVRRTFDNDPTLGVKIAPDLKAAGEWETTEGGKVIARGIGGSVVGRGFKVLLLDDVVKGFAEAHSAVHREAVWDKWLADFQTRLEPPYLVVAIGTRWHEDDFIGRLLSSEHEGDPREIEEIKFPALAEADDVLGRKPGQPLYSPLIEEETEAEALERWAGVKRAVGTYTWQALYQQDPSPSEGAIFNADWWRFWTTNPANVSVGPDGEPDGRVTLWEPEKERNGRWLDSWDMAFKGGDTSDYVVGQRWCKVGTTRYLVGQSRARRTFTSSLAEMKRWSDADACPVPGTVYVHERLVEDKANGTAVIDTLKDQISGIIPINPTDSKEGRARSVSPEVEGGNVRLPYPSDPGNEWVGDFMAEVRNFPNGSHDDQVDAFTQALSRLRDQGRGSIFVPGRVGSIQRNLGQAANTRIARAGGR